MKNYEQMSKNELVRMLMTYETEHEAGRSENGHLPLTMEVHPKSPAPETQGGESRDERQGMETGNLYAAFFEFAPIGFLTFDARGVIREINETGAEMLGRERSLLLNTPFISHIVKNDRKKILCHLARCKQSDDQVTSTMSVSTERGNFFHLQLHSVAVKDSPGNAPLFLTALTDVSEVAEVRSLAEEMALTEEKVRHSIASDLREEVLEFISMAQIRLGRLEASLESPEQLAAAGVIRESIDMAVKRIESLVGHICPA